MSNWQPHGKGSRAMRTLARALYHVEQYGGLFDDDDEYNQDYWKQSDWKKMTGKVMIGKKKIGKKKIGKKNLGKIGKKDRVVGPTRAAELLPGAKRNPQIKN